MAYGSWSSSKWKQVWSNSYYKAEVQWRYQQDPINNKTRYAVQQLRITSLDKAHYFYNASATAGIATITSSRTTSKVSANVQANSSQTFNLADDDREVAHNSNGVVGQECYVHGYFKAGINANGTPEFGWASANITDEIPDIVRTGGTTTVKLESVTTTTAKIQYTSSVSTTLIQYNINNTGWKDAGIDLPEVGGGTKSFTISGLEPAKQYSIQFRHRRDYNQVYSTAKTLAVNTNKPQAPVMNSFDVGEVTGNSIQLIFSGEYGEDYPSKYEANGAFEIEVLNGDTYENIKEVPFSTKSTIIEGLKENTEYTLRIFLKDYYGTSSNYLTVTQKTKLVGVRVKIKVDDVIKEGILYIKADGQIKRASNLGIKEGNDLIYYNKGM